jgi:quercetin dioxygenase-like cupin family protein
MGIKFPWEVAFARSKGMKEKKFDVAGARFTWKVKGEDTGYAFSIYEQQLELGEGVPLHCHAYGEVFYVLSGYIDFLRVTGAGEEWIALCRRRDHHYSDERSSRILQPDG